MMLEHTPKAKEAVKQWLLNKLLESLKDASLPEEFKQTINTDIPDAEVENLIRYNPKILFDFFDEHEIYLNVYPLCEGINTENKKIKYSYHINLFKPIDYVDILLFNTRKTAEQEAIAEAFNLLEEKL